MTMHLLSLTLDGAVNRIGNLVMVHFRLRTIPVL